MLPSEKLDDFMPRGEPFPGETLRADGWVYRDLPRMTRSAWTELESIIGATNMRFLTWADYGDAVRGQCFISPTGIENLKKHREAHNAAK